MNIQDLANLAAIVGAPLAIAALVYTALQLKRTLSVERGRFMLELRQMVARYDRVHKLLRREGAWHGDAGGPATRDDWIEVDDYMGFFEHCEYLLRSGSVEADIFKSIYGYRIENLLLNKAIMQKKLIEERKYWEGFLSLCRRLNYPAPAPSP